MRCCFSNGVTLLFALAVMCFATDSISAQPSASVEPPTTGVVLTRWSPPVYSPLARMASVVGEVRVQVQIRQDGSIESAEVVSGHPMLKQAALESAQKSTFECHSCIEPVASYLLTYTFESKDDGDCCGAIGR